MTFNQTTSEDDLLQLPDIDGLVREIKQQETISSVSGGDKGTDFWSLFLKCSEQYEYRKKRQDRRAFLLDVEIIDTLKNCQINNMSTATLINSVLRAFILQNQETLRQHMTNKTSLI